MSFSIEGKKCECCHAYLFPEDDVVFCPVCGAPHHKSCYNSLGHCALEETHGTDKQYDLIKQEKTEEKPENETKENNGQSENEVKCGMCGQSYGFEEKACPNCHTPNTSKMGGGFVSFDFLGGVPENYDIGENVTADEAKKFVLSNTYRYIPKFARMKTGQKASFNLLAFICPSAWLLSRKIYKLGALITALQVASSMLVYPLANSLMNVIPNDVMTNRGELFRYLTENTPSYDKVALVVATVGFVIQLALMIVFGVFGDWFYRNHAIKTIKDIKTYSEDKEYDFRKLGGVSFIGLLIGIMATQYLPGIIVNLTNLF